MAKFKKGDKVKVSKPIDTSEGPAWVANMDVLDGKTMEVSRQSGEGWLLQDCHFSFDERWLSKINTFKGNV